MPQQDVPDQSPGGTVFDLHVHTALSACAENIMSPARIVRRAIEAGLTMLAITDHNASANVLPAIRAAGNRLRVLPGMEVCSSEEVHVLALFEELEPLLDLQQLIDVALPPLANLADVFGDQLIYDEADEIIDLDPRLRQVGANLSLDCLVSEIHARQGWAVPAHVFRHRFSLWSQLGAVDAGSGFDMLEIAYSQWVREKYRLGCRYAGLPVITGSDAHFLEDIGRVTNRLPRAGGAGGSLVELVGYLHEQGEACRK